MVKDVFKNSSQEEKDKKKNKDGMDLVVLLDFLKQTRERMAEEEKAIAKKNLSDAEKARLEEELSVYRQQFEDTLRNEYGIQDPVEIEKIMSDLSRIESDIKDQFEAKGFYTQQDLDDAVQKAQLDYLKQYRIKDPTTQEALSIEDYQKRYVYEADPASRTGRKYRELASAATSDVSTNQRRAGVRSVLDHAAASAGVHINTMKAMWGVESDFGRNLGSPTGCTGDWQFTKSTFDTMVTDTRHGYRQKIMDALRAGGHADKAAELEAYIKGGLQGRALTYDPIISTYAAAFYIQEVARDVGARSGRAIDASREENGAIVYMGYNVGPANAAIVLRNLDTAGVGQKFAKQAGPNWPFFGTSSGDLSFSGAQVMEEYTGKLGRRLRQYGVTFEGAAPGATNTSSFNSAVANAQSYSANTGSLYASTNFQSQFGGAVGGTIFQKSSILNAPSGSLLGNSFGLANTAFTTSFTIFGGRTLTNGQTPLANFWNPQNQ